MQKEKLINLFLLHVFIFMDYNQPSSLWNSQNYHPAIKNKVF